MSEWQQGDVLTNGIRMHYYRTGGDKPQLVLAHGFSDSGLCWTPVAKALEADYDIIMIDARGHGLSEAPLDGYDCRTMGADLAGLVKALKLDKPAVMGHSMGGGTTLMAITNFPECFSRAILEDAAAHDFPAAMRSTSPDRFAGMMETKSKSREELLAQAHTQPPMSGWSDEELGPWADSKLNLSLNALSFTPVDDEPWRETFKRIQCPVLLIRADNDKGSGVTPEEAAEATRINPLVEVVYVPGAGHNVRRENYDAFMAAVTEFLAR